MKKTKQKRTNKLLIPALTILSLVAVGAYAWQHSNLLMKPQVAQITGGTGTIILGLSPASSTVAGNTPTTLTLTINTAGAKVSAVQAELTYSDTCLTPTVTQGSFLGNVLSSAKVAGGKINFAYAAAPDSGGVMGTGTIATIQTGPKTGNCVVSFTTNTIAGAIGVDTNALASASDATINLQGTTTTSPSPSPSLVASPIPSPSPSIKPSATPSPTQTPATTTNNTINNVNTTPATATPRPTTPTSKTTASGTTGTTPSSTTTSPVTPSLTPLEFGAEPSPSVAPIAGQSGNFLSNLIQSFIDGLKSLFGIQPSTSSTTP